MKRFASLALLTLAPFFAACSGTVSPGTTAERDFLRARSQAAIADLTAKNRAISSLLTSAHAYVIFPNIVVGAAGIGGGHGEGEVYQGGKFVGYADVSQFSIGAQVGGQRFSQLILFQSQTAFINFTHGEMEMDARYSAVATSNGTGDSANYSRGVLVFTQTETGLMAQAAIGGQKFRFTPSLQQVAATK
jgi:lipid-binding SYLF domain-containing protein